MPSLFVKKQDHSIRFTSYASIGRASRCTLSIKDIKLSRIHCEIIRDEEDYILVDLQSHNGTNLNGKAITEIFLKDGDCIEIGKSEVIFSLEPKDTETSYRPMTIKKVGPEDI